MKLYYDMYIPYMPDSTVGEEGKLVADKQKTAGRQAMIELAKFQSSGQIMSLYQSVIFACEYAGCDLVDTLTGFTDGPDIADGTTVTSLLDDAAKLLFKSIKPENSFDINTFTANILNAAHAILSINSQEESEQTDIPTEEAKPLPPAPPLMQAEEVPVDANNISM